MQGQSPRYADAGPIQEAVERRDWRAARLALAEKLARAADATDSARDVKAIAHELVPVLDRCEADQHDADAAGTDSPLAQIISNARNDGLKVV